MDIKEKLIKLLQEFIEVEVWDNGEFIEKDIDFDRIAENLIANGVTVVRHGRWIYNVESGEYVCSACGENALSFTKDTLYGINLYETCLTDYCPNCGAKMDEEVDT